MPLPTLFTTIALFGIVAGFLLLLLVAVGQEDDGGSELSRGASTAPILSR